MKTPLLILALSAAAIAGPLDPPSKGGVQGASGGLAPGTTSMLIKGKVLQKMRDGLIVAPVATVKVGTVVFVEGDFPKHFPGMQFSMTVRDAGSYEYTTTSGAGQIIRKFAAR